MDIIKGTLSVPASMEGELAVAATLSGQLYVPEYIGGTPYSGSYEITPKASQDQTLNTANKLLTDDITVFKVPYYQTSNVYGDTVYIAEESNGN